MKRFFQLLMFPLVIFACEPLEDVYNEIDEANSGISKDLTITLSEEDYEAMEDYEGVPANVYEGYYFADDVEASQYLPFLLSDQYPQIAVNSFAAVTYENLVFALPEESEVLSSESYTVSDDDYDEFGHTYGNFDNEDDIIAFVDARFGDQDGGLLVILTYDYYFGSRYPTTQEQTSAYFFDGENWYSGFRVTDEYYEHFERNRYYNFIADDEEDLPLYMSYILKNEYPQARENTVQPISYVFYDGSSTSNMFDFYVFNGTDWEILEGTITTSSSLNFQNKQEGGWIPDLTVKHTFAQADYDWVVATYAATNPGGTGNMNSYGNFSCYEWTDEQIFTAITERMEVAYAPLTEGQKFIVTYSIYCGASTNEELYILYENGAWSEYDPNE